jgi:hypothetical protein
MIARAGSGWQTVLADLSLILFMVTASALSEAPVTTPSRPADVLPALGEPVALWRQGPDVPALKDWLSANPDPRLRLTIMASPVEATTAVALANEAGRPARILIEPGGTGVIAALTYDQAPSLAQRLQQAPAKETPK